MFNGVITVTVWHMLALTGNAAIAGLTNSMVAVGVFLGAAVAMKAVNAVPGGVIALLAYLFPVMSTALLLLFHSSPWSVLFLLPAMALLPAGSAAIGSLQMLVIPDEKLGRAFSAVGILELIFSAVTTTATGFLYAHQGYMATVAVCVAVMVLCLVHVASVSQIRGIPRADGIEEFAASIA
ncbi:hypothetical protein INS90_07555 [Trueperella pecoris]|uniref:MFS transporter n=1 Tax=Trueperella pecoris TaxID=2733571 RepID=A0A7M1QYU8_9ACTO|nr:hypothetical protein [Trueperella pecoris]QOR47118.1 hypothetical protein INS90_07555 [Trueperella pecoris]